MDQLISRYSDHLAMLVRERVLTYESAQETLAAVRILLGTLESGESGAARPVSESALRRARFIMGQIDEATFIAPSKLILVRAGIAFGFAVGAAVAAIPFYLRFGLDRPVSTTAAVAVGCTIGAGAGVAAGWVWRRMMLEFLIRRHAARLVCELRVRPGTEL